MRPDDLTPPGETDRTTMTETPLRFPSGIPERRCRLLLGGWIAPAIAAALWPALALCILSHRLYVSNDSLSTYAHVWYVAQGIWEQGRVPLRMPLLNGGNGFTFPYAAPPWTLAALLWSLLDEWSVTLLLVVGAAASVAAAVVWQPSVRRPLLLALLVLNPFFIEAVLLAQFPFLWASMFFFLGASAIKRSCWSLATVCLALAQISHPAILLPPVAVLCALTYRRNRERQVLASYVLALALALPAVWLTLATPAISEGATASVLWNYLTTIAPRVLVLAAPVLLVAFRRAIQRHAGWIAAVAVVLPAVLLPSLGDLWAVRQLVRAPSTTAVAAVADDTFAPGAVYRVLDAADGKVSMYRALRAGAVLDADFFPESIIRQSWPDTEHYLAFLQARRVQYVMITRAYDRNFGTNEHALLETLAGSGRAQRIYSDSKVDVFSIWCKPARRATRCSVVAGGNGATE
jgi:hypothetical protein